MAIQHAQSGEVIDVRPLNNGVQLERSSTLLKTDALEVIRLVLPAGKQIAEHAVSGNVTVQCLEGKVTLAVAGNPVELKQGDLMYLDGGQRHGVCAIQDSSLLVTILLDTNRH